MTKPSNLTALEKGTRRTWEEWVKVLEPHRELNHTDMARMVREILLADGLTEKADWWAQGVTVAYEQYIGRRVPGQSCDGEFNVNSSRTLEGDMDAALTWWLEQVQGLDAFNGVAISREGAVSRTEKWRYWRCGLADGSRVNIHIQNKAGGKANLSVNHEGLASAEEAETWRAYWKAFAR